MTASMPRLILLSEMFPPAVGGSAVLFGNLYSRLGCPIQVMTNARGGSPAGLEYVRDVRIDGSCRGIVGGSAMAHHWRLARRLRALGPAVVHCGRAMPEGIAAMLASLVWRRSPFAVWVHGEEINSALQSREHTWVMRQVHRRAGLLLANSRNTREVLQRVGADVSKIRVIYPGVDVTRFAERSSDPRTQDPIILSVGRLQRRKGHDMMLLALARVIDRHPRVTYVIVGDGEERSRLESMVRELGLGAHVRFEGEVPEASLPGYFARADVFALPNRVERGDFEGFGIVFLEAAAAGVPTVGGRSGGVPEAIAEGETGFLVGGEDADEIAATLHRLLSDPELARSLGRAGRRRVLRDFTWEASASRLREAHLELAAAHGISAAREPRSSARTG